MLKSILPKSLVSICRAGGKFTTLVLAGDGDWPQT